MIPFPCQMSHFNKYNKRRHLHVPSIFLLFHTFASPFHPVERVKILNMKKNTASSILAYE